MNFLSQWFIPFICSYWDMCLMALAVIAALSSAIWARHSARYAKKANAIAEDANKKSDKANRIAEEANREMVIANEISTQSLSLQRELWDTQLKQNTKELDIDLLVIDKIKAIVQKQKGAVNHNRPTTIVFGNESKIMPKMTESIINQASAPLQLELTTIIQELSSRLCGHMDSDRLSSLVDHALNRIDNLKSRD